MRPAGVSPTLDLDMNRMQHRIADAQTTAYGAQKFEALDTSAEVVGHRLQVPRSVSPLGSLRSLYPKADAVASQLAGEFGKVMTLSTLSRTPMEEVTAATAGGCWFQLYLCGGKETALRGIARAKAAGFRGLLLTLADRWDHAIPIPDLVNGGACIQVEVPATARFACILVENENGKFWSMQTAPIATE